MTEKTQDIWARWVLERQFAGDPEKRKAKIPKQSGLRDVLYLAFHDAEPTANMTVPPDIMLMTSDQAKQIWSFVRKSTIS